MESATNELGTSSVRNGRSWLDLRQAVRQSHKGAAAMNRIPQSFTLREEVNERGELQRRIYLLSTFPGQRENTLIYANLLCGNNLSSSKLLIWEPMLTPRLQQSSTGGMSKEEQLLRERKRIRSLGITSYDYQELTGSGGIFAFCSNSSLFVCSDPMIDGHLSVS